MKNKYIKWLLEFLAVGLVSIFIVFIFCCLNNLWISYKMKHTWDNEVNRSCILKDHTRYTALIQDNLGDYLKKRVIITLPNGKEYKVKIEYDPFLGEIDYIADLEHGGAIYFNINFSPNEIKWSDFLKHIRGTCNVSIYNNMDKVLDKDGKLEVMMAIDDY